MSAGAPGATGAELTGGISGDVRRGLAWSSVNSLVLRLGTLLLGIVLARLLAPEDFGVYAIALTIQSILVTLADLGMSVDLVRARDPARRAPTVATLSLVSGALLALAMSLTAKPIAAAMDAPDAAPVIVVLSWTLVISGAGVVPYAQLQRNFQQRELFACSVVEFATGTALTIGLILSGMGPMALAIGRVVAQCATTSLQFVLARVRPHFGFDRDIARSALAFGVPLAGANLLSWAVLSVHNVAIAGIAGTAALGLYVLAFNVSSWPMSAIGQAIRGVSLAGFSRASRDREGDGGFALALSLSWAAGLLVGVLLAALAQPLVVSLYGSRWSTSASILAALGIFGALRVALDVIATFLLAKGTTRAVFYVQALWFLTLIPVVVVATYWKGVEAAGWSHLAVAAIVVLPAYALALRRVGVPLRSLVGAMWLPAVAAVPTWCVAHAAATQVQRPLLGLAVGGLAGCAVYVAVCYRWLRRLLPATGWRRRRRTTPLAEHAQPEGAT
jgi:lipopolysaccharide exporter